MHLTIILLAKVALYSYTDSRDDKASEINKNKIKTNKQKLIHQK